VTSAIEVKKPTRCLSQKKHVRRALLPRRLVRKAEGDESVLDKLIDDPDVPDDVSVVRDWSGGLLGGKE
jgi:hypothetical protein